MEEKIDELKSQRIFDLSTTKGIRSFCAQLVGELHLMDGNLQRSSIKGWFSYNHPIILIAAIVSSCRDDHR